MPSEEEEDEEEERLTRSFEHERLDLLRKHRLVDNGGILINGQFPGPPIENGIKQRKNSWLDGVLGTNCPIPPNSNYTYTFQVKNQIGTYTYFPSTSMYRAAGAFGAFNIHQRSVIAIPYPIPVEDFTLLVGDWYTLDYKELQQRLDSSYDLPYPNGLLINGWKTSTFIGYHTLQEQYDSLDIHVGQSVAELVTLDKPDKDYFIPILNATAILHMTVLLLQPLEKCFLLLMESNRKCGQA
ncbi:Multicopper oxidase, N-terminal [Dillenia turbinata]|uniref:Multicopper oxidase, N-terminal n=1 Tax=Dillenia turbinata TaxID=194707 RepID=A0AAN8UTN1_9MAGN